MMYICKDCISTRTEEDMMSVRRSAQIITAAVPLLLVGAAAPALALDQAPPAAVETASAQEGLSVPLEISGIVDGLGDRETASVEGDLKIGDALDAMDVEGIALELDVVPFT